MLYKDLTPKQQEHLQAVYKEAGQIPEDATHIDEERYNNIHKDLILKICDGYQYFFAGRSVEWEVADSGTFSHNYFEIPTDFCRVTGKILPSDNPEQATFPDFPFKLSCGDRPEVRQWLKDNGCSWNSGCDMFESWSLGKKYLLINIDKSVLHVAQERYSTGYEEYFEIQPTIGVTGYTLTESSKARKETLDKLYELRNNAEVIQKQIEELEKTL